MGNCAAFPSWSLLIRSSHNCQWCDQPHNSHVQNLHQLIACFSLPPCSLATMLSPSGNGDNDLNQDSNDLNDGDNDLDYDGGGL